MKAPKDIKKALAICRAGEGCKYGTNPDCPYRINDASCNLAWLVSDAKQLIECMDYRVEELENKIDKAAKALGYDCDECDRW